MPGAGLVAWQGAVFVALSFVLFGLTGWAAGALLAREHDDLLDRVFADGALGLAVGSFLHFLLTWVHPLVPCLAGLALVAVAFRRRAGLVAKPARDLWVLALVAIVVLARMSNAGYLVPRGDQVGVVGYLDQLYHIGIIDELGRGVPPLEMPWVAGEPFWAYHIFGDLFEATLVRWGGLDPFVVRHLLAPALVWTWIALGLFVVVRRWTRSAVAGALAVVCYFAPFGQQAEHLQYLEHNAPAGYGLVIVLAMIFAVTRCERDAARGADVALGFLCGALFMFKANYFLYVAAGYATWVAITFVRDRPTAIRSAAAGALSLGPLAVYIVFLAPSRPMSFEYGAFATYLASTDDALAQMVADMGPVTGPLVAVLVFTIGRVCSVYGLATVSGLFVASRDDRLARGPWMGMVAASAVVWIAILLLVVEPDRGRFASWNVAGHTMPVPRLVAMAGGVWALCSLGQGLWRRVDRRLMVGALLAAQLLITADAFTAAEPTPYVKLYRSTYGLLSRLRTELPDDAVLMSNVLTKDATVISAVTGRRVVVERSETLKYYVESVRRRVDDVAEAYRTPDAARFSTIAERYGVTHVLEWKRAPLRLTDRSSLEVVADSDRVRVLKLARQLN